MEKIRIKLSPGEMFLLQLIGWMGLWLLNDYVATLLTLCLGAVVFAVLVVAVISELIERSKVPKTYFRVMAFSLLAMIIAAAAYVWIFGGRLDFMRR